jgi:hypothetical protein
MLASNNMTIFTRETNAYKSKLTSDLDKSELHVFMLYLCMYSNRNNIIKPCDLCNFCSDPCPTLCEFLFSRVI